MERVLLDKGSSFSFLLDKGYRLTGEGDKVKAR